MSLSSCEQCWDDPCTCGYGYRRWSDHQIAAQRNMLSRLLVERAAGRAKRYVDPPPPNLTRADYERSIPIPADTMELDEEKESPLATVMKMIDSEEQRRHDEYIDLILYGDKETK